MAVPTDQTGAVELVAAGDGGAGGGGDVDARFIGRHRKQDQITELYAAQMPPSPGGETSCVANRHSIENQTLS